jgi:hypothetical protein
MKWAEISTHGVDEKYNNNLVERAKEQGHLVGLSFVK